MAALRWEDAAFRGAGTKPGLQIWCAFDSRLTLIPKSSHGTFFSGSCYLVLNTVARKSGANQHEIHYWVGMDSDKSDADLVSDKALELDVTLGSCTVQYLELQGSETEKFLSYFKPCIIPTKGVFSPAAAGLANASQQIRLLKCKGDHAVHVTEVPFSRSSLNHDDVFILNTAAKIFLFCGLNSCVQERAKALEVVQYIRDNKHGERCEISNIEDGKFEDSDTAEFWSLFGGYAPLARSTRTYIAPRNASMSQLFGINKGKIAPFEAASLEKQNLDTHRCYMLNCGDVFYVWMGRNTLVTERKMAISAAEDFIRSQDRSIGIHMTLLTEGFETAEFKSYFKSWPQNAESSLYEEGREKVAAIFKQQGYDVKEIPEESNHQQLKDFKGTIKVWLVNHGALSLIPAYEQNKLYNGDCYIVQYTYLYDEKSYCLLYAWFGRKSTTEEKAAAISNMSIMANSSKGHTVMAQIFEGKEPCHFLSIFNKLIIFKGCRSSGKTKSVMKSGYVDEAYDKDKSALFRVQGNNPNCVQASQVDLVSSSLNSAYCYILQHEAYIYAWAGNLSSDSDLDLAYRVLHLINPLKQPMSIREGAEPDDFWNAIGPKMEYPREKEIKICINEPHLFSCVLKEGNFKGNEIFNFSQDDLNTEDVLVLNNFNEIYIWVGKNASVKSLSEAFTIGKLFQIPTEFSRSRYSI